MYDITEFLCSIIKLTSEEHYTTNIKKFFLAFHSKMHNSGYQLEYLSKEVDIDLKINKDITRKQKISEYQFGILELNENDCTTGLLNSLNKFGVKNMH